VILQMTGNTCACVYHTSTNLLKFTTLQVQTSPHFPRLVCLRPQKTISRNRLCKPIPNKRVVLATVPGYPASVRVAPGTNTAVRIGNPQGTELGNKRWVVTRTGPKPCVFWLGRNRTAGLFCCSYIFGSN